ncbi:unnamed protein product, partial [Durusdinium trenchii]
MRSPFQGELGSSAQSCDITKDMVTQDLSSTMGLLRFMRLALRCQEGALGVLGTPCNSFGWMATSQHCRSYQNPWGDQSYPWVVLGNILASRSCLTILVLIARSVFWLVENPDHSQLRLLPPLVHIMSIPEILPLRVSWAMGYFGGWSIKPEMGFGNWPWMPYLNQKITKAMRLQIRQRAEVQRKQMVKTTVSKSSNKKSVSGGADMGASAAYPRDFGRHVASSHVSIINDPSTTLPDLQALVNGGFR